MVSRLQMGIIFQAYPKLGDVRTKNQMLNRENSELGIEIQWCQRIVLRNNY
jgi:hypothetical protein